MDEALVTCAVDLSGRPFFAWNAVMPSPSIGTFDSELVEEFFRAMAMNVRMNLHVILHSGRNSHHVSEAIFKATARAMRIAVALDARVDGIPSTKGSL
jgi:imidazoleglycerol-phosphate dehydratase